MTKKKLYRYSVIALFVVGIAVTIVPFAKSMYPPQYKLDIEHAKYNSSLEIDISKLEEGRIITVEWQGIPIGIYKRTKEDIESLRKSNNLVYDPYSKKQSLPGWWRTGEINKTSIDLTSKWLNTSVRSQMLEYFVFVKVSPIYGCAISLMPKEASGNHSLDPSWLGGFYDPCSEVKFDYSGRVYAGRSNGRHLLIPPHSFVNGGTVELIPNG